MTGRVLRGVKEQAEHVRWELRATDTPKLEQLIASRLAKVIHRSIDVRGGFPHQIPKRGGRFTGFAFGTEHGLLSLAQPFTTSVCEQPIERSAEVSHVKADRGRAAGPKPH